jgi:hypothetical protein
LNYIVKNESKYTLWKQSLDEEAVHFVADLGDEEISDFAVAPDETDFAIVRGKWIHDAVLIDGLR